MKSQVLKGSVKMNYLEFILLRPDRINKAILSLAQRSLALFWSKFSLKVLCL